MGASLSREGAIDEYDDSSDEEEEAEAAAEEETEEEEQKKYGAQIGAPSSSSSSSGDSLGRKMEAFSLHEKNGPALIPPSIAQAAKLYRYARGSTAKTQWLPVSKSALWRFTRSTEDRSEGEGEGEEEDGNEGFLTKEPGVPKGFKRWFLIVEAGQIIRARVSLDLQMKFFEEQRRADFVKDSVWSLKFPTPDSLGRFMTQYHSCLFENTHFLEATAENKMRVFGKDFVGWVDPQESDDTIWEDVSESFETPANDEKRKKLREAYSEASSSGGIQSLTLGAGENSFLIGGSGIEAFRNTPEGLRGKAMAISFSDSVTSSPSYGGLVTPKKGILMRGESNMMVLSPAGEVHARGVRQLDLNVGKVVTEWRFEKDGTPITMRDVSNESKGAQLDPSTATFLGLDDNRLCRWDMRDRSGIVQELDTSDPPSLNWSGGHQFARGTDFQCFASAGDGSIAVGSKDGKVRLYSTTSMRVAKTAFPSLGSPITSIDVTFDGNWVLATADNHLILISTVFRDKDGRMKTGFSGRMGNKIAAPRLLRLTPLDAHLAGKNYKFSGGRFSWITESGRQERYLVATVGKFTVIWNFRRVKESKHECFRQTQGLKSCYCYRIVPKEESIVDSRFMHDNYMSNSPEAPLVVATPMNVSSFNAWSDD